MKNSPILIFRNHWKEVSIDLSNIELNKLRAKFDKFFWSCYIMETNDSVAIYNNYYAVPLIKILNSEELITITYIDMILVRKIDLEIQLIIDEQIIDLYSTYSLLSLTDEEAIIGDWVIERDLTTQHILKIFNGYNR